MRFPSKKNSPNGGGRHPRGVWAVVIVAAVAVCVATVVWLLPGSSFAPSSDVFSSEQQADEQGTDTSDENVPTDQAVVGESKTDSAEVQPAATSGGDTPTVSEPYEQGVVLLRVDPGETAEDVSQKLANVDGVTTKDVSDQDLSRGFVRVKTAEGVSVEDAVKQLDEVGLSSQPNFAYTIADDGDEGSGSEASDAGEAASTASEGATEAKADVTTLNDAADYFTQVDSAWDIVKTNKAVSVAVLDTGCRVTHEDLKDNIVDTYDATVGNAGNHLSDDVKDVTDINGHGTHVAGIVAAEADNGKGVDGVSYNAGIVAVKVFPSYDIKADDNSYKHVDSCYTDDLVTGYDYVIANKDRDKIRVVNMSIQGGRSVDWPGTGEGATDKLLEGRIQSAYDKGIVTVASAGNANGSPNSLGDGKALLPYKSFPVNLNVPIVGVMNLITSFEDGVRLSGDSNYCISSETQGTTNKNISAPGNWINSTFYYSDSDYTHMSGTSMASPYVAGVLSLEFAADPSLTPQRAIDILYQTATDLDDKGWDAKTGYGCVNAYRAVSVTTGTNKSLNDATLDNIAPQLQTTAGAAVTPDPVVTYGTGLQLVRGKDYTVSYANNTSTGIATVTITGIGSFTGTKTANYFIVDAPIDFSTAASASSYSPSGSLYFNSYYNARFNVNSSSVSHFVSSRQTQTYTSASYTLVEGKDYNVTYSSPDESGNVTATFQGIGVFTGSHTESVQKRSKIDISSDYNVAIGDVSGQVLTDGEAKPVPTVYDYSGHTLVPGIDCTLSYKNNTKEARVTDDNPPTIVVTGIGNYTGTREIKFNIIGKKDISGTTAKLPVSSFTYTGSPIEPTVTLFADSSQTSSLRKKEDVNATDPSYYTTYDDDHTNVGTKNITVHGINSYEGTKTIPYTITPADISSATISAIPDQTYTGSALEPTGFTVTWNVKTLANGRDYTVSYENNNGAGTGKVIITGKNNFTGTVTATFNIQAQQPETITTYRLYNPYSGEHLFTQNYSEYQSLKGIGWRQEGLAWVSPKTSNTPVYRLYNPYSGDHHYTTNKGEYDSLGRIGWNQEGIGFYSAESSDRKPVYRLFNPYVTVGTHHYTTSKDEYDYLGRIGWNQENIGWYCL